jgi:hypothetical protein
MLLNDLVNSMNGQSTTCGWDVVVSYSVSKLNGVLQEMWNRGKYSTSPIDDYIDPTKTIRITFDVEVDSPSLQFLDGEKVLLKFGLAGRSWRSKPDEALDKQTAKESTFHRGQHTLEVEVPLVTVSGDVVESGDVERLKEAAKVMWAPDPSYQLISSRLTAAKSASVCGCGLRQRGKHRLSLPRHSPERLENLQQRSQWRAHARY